MKDQKLNIDLLPKGAWGNDFSKTLSKKDWDKIREKCYEKANHKCQICGYETDDLDAHEVWEFNIKNKTQILIDIIGICGRCHGVVHMRNSQRLGFGENAKRHFMEVNKCDEMTYASHLSQAELEYEERNAVLRWKIKADLSRFSNDNIEIKQVKIPLIKSRYMEQEIENSKNNINFNPKLLKIEINNYNGTIDLQCENTNKVEWFIDNQKVKTKYNFGGRFNTSFNVKNQEGRDLYFVLSTNDKKYISLHFDLLEIV